MAFYLVKLLLTAGLVVVISELSKRFTALGATLASLPLLSLLSMIWMYYEGASREKITDFAASVFWLVLPSLALFLILPALLRAGWSFWPSLALASCLTVSLYLLELWVLP